MKQKFYNIHFLQVHIARRLFCEIRKNGKRTAHFLCLFGRKWTYL